MLIRTVDGMIIKSWYKEEQEPEIEEKTWSPQARASSAQNRGAKSGGGGLGGKIRSGFNKLKAGVKEQFRTQSNQEMQSESNGKTYRAIGGLIGGNTGARIGENLGKKVVGFTGKIQDRFEYGSAKNTPPMPKVPKQPKIGKVG